MRIFCIFLIIFFLYSDISADVTGTGAASLMFDALGSRSLALKESVTAIGSGPEAIAANPALISTIDKLSISMMYLKWFAGMNFLFFAGAMPLPLSNFEGTVGLAVTAFSSGDFEKFVEGSPGSEGTTSADDYNIAVSYARNVGHDFQTGINLKIIQSTLDEYSETSIGADMGIVYSVIQLQNPLKIGLAVQNIGSSQKFISEGTALPMNIKAGLGYFFTFAKMHNLIADFDVNYPNDSELITRLGIEYSFMSKLNLKIASFRIGLQPTGRKNNMFSIGMGSELPLSSYVKDYQFSIDYAMVPLDELGYNHAVTVNILFNEGVSKLFGVEKIEEKKEEQEKAEEEIDIIEEESIEKTEETIESEEELDEIIKEMDSLEDKAPEEEDIETLKELEGFAEEPIESESIETNAQLKEISPEIEKTDKEDIKKTDEEIEEYEIIEE